ncbi:MAG: hypothetical protein M3Q30_06120 [Actinomycetota bacterium]|nr:hypothetical protein [Actinomycetota bacterium]
MPLTGRSHFVLVAATFVYVVALFVVFARVTTASRRRVVAALVGAVAAAAVNVALDTAAYDAGWWRYPEATTPFGPLVYYLIAGVGCGVFALIGWWLLHRFGWRGPLTFLGVFAIYGPIRDAIFAGTTGLIDFSYSPLVVVADSLFEYIIPMLIALTTVLVLAPDERIRATRSGPTKSVG